MKRAFDKRNWNMPSISIVAITLALVGIWLTGLHPNSMLIAQVTGDAKPAAQESKNSPAQVKSRLDNMEHLKRLARAMLTYENTTSHLPPAAIRSKEGKPLLSWRVAILPYLDQKDLYQQFHLDEPWDSENNLTLISKMPAVFRHPNDDSNSTNASYFMPTGKGTIGENLEGCRLRHVRDGASHTVMIVSTQRDIPWTKPKDIDVDLNPAKRLPRFGGNTKDETFAVARADGSVVAISESIDERLLRPMLTIAGGENLDDILIDFENPPQLNNVRPKGETQP